MRRVSNEWVFLIPAVAFLLAFIATGSCLVCELGDVDAVPDNAGDSLIDRVVRR